MTNLFIRLWSQFQWSILQGCRFGLGLAPARAEALCWLVAGGNVSTIDNLIRVPFRKPFRTYAPYAGRRGIQLIMYFYIMAHLPPFYGCGCGLLLWKLFHSLFGLRKRGMKGLALMSSDALYYG